MPRVCIRKSDNKFIESQSNDTAKYGTLIINAINSGYVENEIEEKVVSKAELILIIENSKTQIEKDVEKKEKLISSKIKDKQRKDAIKDLKTEGKLDSKEDLIKQEDRNALSN